LFLFLSTNDHSFLNMIGAELIRERFIQFAENLITDKISGIYK